ncbi:MAG: penicillin-binding protein 2 [Actinobacteria bacterium]|nr:penicillin-binding protein 2 [Actinomycetota bacterium]
MFQLQILDSSKYSAYAADQRERDVVFPARRGTIFDREGQPLAISVDLNTVFADPAHVTDAVTSAKKLAPVLGLTSKEIQLRLSGTFPGDRFEYIARQVAPKVARKVKALEIPGVYLQTEPKRYYPGGRLASHLLGFVNIDGSVLAGMEHQYQSILEGSAGRMTLEQDPQGRPLPQAEFTYEAPNPGKSLFLTIDKELQYFTELTLADAVERYRAAAGTAIILRPQTGEILALANVPDFDPNHPGDSDADAQRNRAITDVYEPGSAFKIVTAAAALEEGVVTPQTSFSVPDAFQVSDRIFHDSHSHPTETMTVAQIIEQSSNVGTIKVGLELGADKIDEYVRRFGFGASTGLDFPSESSGIVLPREEWTGPTIATVPIGQGIAVTPVQMAAAYGVIANGGVWVEPKLLYGAMTGGGEMKPSAAPTTRRVVSVATARKMARILTGVVDSGTGIEAQVPGYEVAGKTGTAQKPLPTGGYGDSYTGSFGGFAPADDPQIVVLVILDEPNPIWGGTTAAPTFKIITEYALRYLGASPTANAAEAAKAIEAEKAEEPAAHD